MIVSLPWMDLLLYPTAPFMPVDIKCLPLIAPPIPHKAIDSEWKDHQGWVPSIFMFWWLTFIVLLTELLQSSSRSCRCLTLLPHLFHLSCQTSAITKWKDRQGWVTSIFMFWQLTFTTLMPSLQSYILLPTASRIVTQLRTLPLFFIGLRTVPSDGYGHTINSQVTGTGSPVHCLSSHVSKLPMAMGRVRVWP